MTGAMIGDVLTPEHIALVLAHPLGVFKGAPRRARRIVVLNQADRDIDVRNADRIIDALRRTGETASAGAIGLEARIPAVAKAVVSSIGNGPPIRSIVSL
jgi:probable selenium-dependent hydroxylase accessory protein YqeC